MLTGRMSRVTSEKMGFDRYQELGRRIDAAWDRVGRDVSMFSGIAEAALSDFDPPGFCIDEVGRFLLETDIVQQPQTKFSNLPVTLHVGEGFYLELLVWTRSTTSIHQHGFSGAFRVIAGSSLHTDYRFQMHRRLDDRASVGEVHPSGMRLLRSGDVVPIRSGPEGLTHALFHLDNPSVTLVARTIQDAGAGPQYELFKPGISLDAPWARADARLTMMRRWLAVCADLGNASADESIMERVLALDFAGLCSILLEHGRFLGVDRSGSSFLPRLEECHPGLSSYMVEAFRFSRSQESLAAVRRDVDDPELRYFVALLMNAPGLDELSEMLRIRNPDRDAIGQCAALLVGLGTARRTPLALQSGSPLLARLAMAMGNAGADAGLLVEAMLRGESIVQLPQMAGSADRLHRLLQSEKALRTTPELSVLFDGRRAIPGLA